MIQIVPCPNCEKSSVLAAEVAKTEPLTCPHCGEQTTLQKVTASYASWAVGPSVDDDDAPLELQKEETPNSAAESEAARAEAAKKAAWKGFQPVTHEQFERMKRKQRSPIWSILQIVLGGLAAFPIALGILWYGLGKDVMDAGPTIARYAPWLVPEQFHPIDDSDFRNEQTTAPERRSGLPAPTMTDDDESKESAVDLDELMAAAENPAPSPPELKATPTAEDELTQQAIIAQFPFTRGLFTAIGACEGDLISWQQNRDNPDADLRSMAQVLYGRLLSIASQLDLFPGESRAFRYVRDRMQGNSGRIKRRSDLQSLVQQGAAARFSSVDESNQQPIAMILRIRKAELEAGIWAVEAEALPPLTLPENLDLAVPRYLSPALIENQKIFVLGIITPRGASKTNEEPRAVFRAKYLYSFGSRDNESEDNESEDDNAKENTADQQAP